MNTWVSKIDSDRFKIKVVKINDIDILVKSSLINDLKNDNVKLIISRIPTENSQGINYLEELGFRIMDVQSTYIFDLEKGIIRSIKANPDVLVRNVEDKDVSELSIISMNSFEGYGHYFADNRLDKNHCRSIYKDWAIRSIIDENVADKVFVAEANGTIAGFLSFKLFQNNAGYYAAGGIGAVDKNLRGNNIFSMLTLKGLTWGNSIGLKWEEHNVLNTNYPVNAVFSKLGFIIKKSFVTLHKWID